MNNDLESLFNVPEPTETPSQSSDFVVGVRYSLPAMLAEIRAEQISGAFSLEKLDQKEIGKLFKQRKRNRAKPTE